LQVLANTGIAAIRAHNNQLLSIFRDGLPADWRAQIDLGRTGGTICLTAGDALPDVLRALQANAVRFDCRGTVLRLSFHIYNTAAEAACIAHCLSGALP
jgi:selenocysteine lyase/cysteine desulfurase